jgi:hypothetical protein
VWEEHYSNGKLPSHIKKGTFWWRDILKLLDCYKSFSTIQIQNGQSCLLWVDKWKQHPLHAEFPELFSFARNSTISVSKFVSQQPIHEVFSLPLLLEAFQQLQALQSIRDELLLSDQHDVWSSDWGCFSSSKAYKHLTGHRQVPRAFVWL